MPNETVPAPHIPTPAHPLSTPRLPSNTGPTIPAPDSLEGFYLDFAREVAKALGHDTAALTFTIVPATCMPDEPEDDAPEVNDDCETEAEWLDRRLGW